MDVFSRTFLPAAAEAGIATPTVNRHLPIFKRCVEADDATVLVTRCLRSTAHRGDCVLLLTYRRLVVTEETFVLRRLRLHLNTDLRHLTNVTWNAGPRQSALEFAATAVDGVRERFWMRVSDPGRIAPLDELLHYVFRSKVTDRRVAVRPAAGAALQPASA
jgi:hypothetical protein